MTVLEKATLLYEALLRLAPANIPIGIGYHIGLVDCDGQYEVCITHDISAICNIYIAFEKGDDVQGDFYVCWYNGDLLEAQNSESEKLDEYSEISFPENLDEFLTQMLGDIYAEWKHEESEDPVLRRTKGVGKKVD